MFQIPPNIFQNLPGYMQGAAAAGPKWSSTNPFRTVDGIGPDNPQTAYGSGLNKSAAQLYDHFRSNGRKAKDFGFAQAGSTQSIQDFLSRRNPVAPEAPAPTDPSNPTTPTVPGLPPGFPFNLPPGFQLPQFLQNYMQQQNQPVPEPMPKNVDFSKSIPLMPGNMQNQLQQPAAQTQMNGLMTNFVKPQPTQPLPQGANHMQAPQVPQFDPSIFNIPQPMPQQPNMSNLRGGKLI